MSEIGSAEIQNSIPNSNQVCPHWRCRRCGGLGVMFCAITAPGGNIGIQARRCGWCGGHGADPVIELMPALPRVIRARSDVYGETRQRVQYALDFARKYGGPVPVHLTAANLETIDRLLGEAGG